MVREARLRRGEGGVEPATEGWFVVNVRDAAWLSSEGRGSCCVFEGEEAPFADVGFTLAVLLPGKPSGLYHREPNQEDFLVLAGECVLLVEGEERPLRPWDFVHCPPGTEHAFAATGDGPCAVFMTGGRTRDEEIVYPRSELALRHGVGAAAETTSPAEAYAGLPGWQPGDPEDVGGLPWS